MGMGPISTTPKPVTRSEEIKARISMINDSETGELQGYKLSFFPPSHSEEEHLIERELFGTRMNSDGEVSICYFDPGAVARGKHNFENHKRKRDGKPSIEEEAKAKQEAADAEAKREQEKADAAAKAAADAAPKTDPDTTIQ